MLGEAVKFIVDEAIDPKALASVRPFDVRGAAQWIIRLIYTFLIWEDPEHERDYILAFLSPALVADD